MFGIGGERDLSEREIGLLSSWCGSGLVRAGNGAWAQRQLDVYGSLLDAAYTLRAQLGELDEPTRAFLVDAAAACWGDDDQGIWEIRGPSRPYLHSKLMCWVALDRGLAMIEQLRPEQDRAAAWTAARAELRQSILTRGWNGDVGAYTQFYGSDALDASTLLMAVVGFLPRDDERLLATIDVIEAGLSDERGLLYRYRGDDGFDEPEGTFLLCTLWLAHALALTGQVTRARPRWTARPASRPSWAVRRAGRPATGDLLGNFPQAFSHLGLVNAAQALADAERRTASAR